MSIAVEYNKGDTGSSTLTSSQPNNFIVTDILTCYPSSSSSGSFSATSNSSFCQIVHK